MSESEHIARLLFRYIRKELSPAESAELKTWREASAANEEFFRTETDPDFIRAAYTRRFQAKEIVHRKIQNQYPGPWEQKKKNRVIPMFRIPRAAAAVLITIMLGAGYWLFLGQNHHQKPGEVVDAENTYAKIELFDGAILAMSDFNRGALAGWANIDFERTPRGERVYAATHKDVEKNKMFKLFTVERGHLILRLPDSSHVWLNEQSSIWYPPNFSGDSIKIIIKGEAYIQLAKNSKKVFCISLPSTVNRQPSTNDTLLITTSSANLNLRSYPDEDVTTMTLLKGKVTVRANEKTMLPLELLSGQQTIWDGEKLSSPVKADIKKVMTWEKW